MALLKFLRIHWDRVGGWFAIAVGAVVITVGWVGVSGTSYVFEQLPFIISGGVGGLFLLGLGATLLLSADLRDEWRKLDGIDEHLTNSWPRNADGPGTDEVATLVDPGDAPHLAGSPAAMTRLKRRAPLTAADSR